MGFAILGNRRVLGRRDDYRKTVESFLNGNGFNSSHEKTKFMGQKNFFDLVFRKMYQNNDFSHIENELSNEKLEKYIDYLSDSMGNVSSIEQGNYNHVAQFPLGITGIVYESNNKAFPGVKANYWFSEVSLPEEYNGFKGSNSLYVGILQFNGLNKDYEKAFYQELKNNFTGLVPENNS